VEALAAIGSPGAMAGLERAVDDSDRAVRLAALTAVAAKGYRAALKRLEAVVQGKGPNELERAERRQFFEAYATVAGAAALPMLAEILEPKRLFRRRETSETRTCAAYAIARLQSPEARAVLERIQQDKDLPVRNAAIRALREWPA
jgi:HEAT repeat protein